MFRRKRTLEAMLAEGHATRAHAVVLKVTTIVPGTTDVSAGLTGGRYRVHARVEPDGQVPFEAEFNVHPDLPGNEPHEGQLIPVIFNPQDQDEVMWDEQAAGSEAAAKRGYDRERRERIRAERTAQGLPPIEADTAPDPEIVAKLQALQERKDRGELTDWDFRVARSEIFKDAGF